MTKSSSIVVTGAAGFIGSCLTGFLNEKGFEQLILVDEFSRLDKVNNLKGKKFSYQVERDDFFHWLEQKKQTGHIIHISFGRQDGYNGI